MGGKRRRLPQYGNFAGHVQLGVRCVDVLFEYHVRMVVRIAGRQDGVKRLDGALVSDGVANPAFLRRRNRVVVVDRPVQPDELRVRLIERLLESPQNSSAITVAEAGVRTTGRANQRSPSLSGRVGDERPSVLEPHQVEEVSALVPRGERVGLNGVRIEHQKSSSSRSSKKPCGQRSMNSPVLSIRRRVAWTSPSTCSRKTTET